MTISETLIGPTPDLNSVRFVSSVLTLSLACSCSYVCALVCMPWEAEERHQMSPGVHRLIFWDGGLSMELMDSVRLLVVREFHWSSRFCLPRAVNLGSSHHACFLSGWQGANSGSQDWSAIVNQFMPYPLQRKLKVNVLEPCNRLISSNRY